MSGVATRAGGAMRQVTRAVFDEHAGAPQTLETSAPSMRIGRKESMKVLSAAGIRGNARRARHNARDFEVMG